MLNYLYNQKGSALVLVIMVLVVLSILSITLLNVSLADTKHSIRGEKQTRAHYLGRSGVNVGLAKLKSKVPYDNEISDLVSELNTWAASVSPITISSTEQCTLSYVMSGPREIKIISEGRILGSQVIKETVTLRVKMLTSLLTGGKAVAWYTSANSHNLIASNIPATPGWVTFLGKGVYMEGKSNSATSFPSNAAGLTSTFQASIIQFLKNSNNVCLGYSGNVQDTMFDAEILIFDGIIRLNDTLSSKLLLSEVVAKNKINNTPASVLYVTNSTVRTSIETTGNPSGVGFENINYYNYFINGTYASYSSYPFVTTPYTRYGIVYFGNKLVRANTDGASASATDRLPHPDTAIYANGYFFYPDGINLNADPSELSSRLIPIRKDDPIVALIEVITKVNISGEPFIWDRK